MDMVVKVVVAFAIGTAAMAGLQTAGLFSLRQYLVSDAARRAVPEMKPAFANMKIEPITLPKTPPIDTRAGQEAAMRSYATQIDRQIRAAQNAVPQPVRIPGMPR